MSRKEKECNFLDLMSNFKGNQSYKPIPNLKPLEYKYVKYLEKFLCQQNKE